MNWILEQLKTISRWWELQAPGLEAKGPAGTALVALAKRFCSVLCCLIFNWVLHLGTLRLQLLRPQLRGCSVRQASLCHKKRDRLYLGGPPGLCTPPKHPPKWPGGPPSFDRSCFFCLLCLNNYSKIFQKRRISK